MANGEVYSTADLNSRKDPVTDWIGDRMGSRNPLDLVGKKNGQVKSLWLTWGLLHIMKETLYVSVHITRDRLYISVHIRRDTLYISVHITRDRLYILHSMQYHNIAYFTTNPGRTLWTSRDCGVTLFYVRTEDTGDKVQNMFTALVLSSWIAYCIAYWHFILGFVRLF